MAQRHGQPAPSPTLSGTNNSPRVGPVAISELMYNPPAAGGCNRLISSTEIYNPTNSEVDLSHWTIGSGVNFAFPLGAKLPAQQALVVVRFDPALPENAALLAGFRAVYGLTPNVPLMGGFLGALDNAGETVRLFRPDEPSQLEPDLYPQLLESSRLRRCARWPTSRRRRTRSRVIRRCLRRRRQLIAASLARQRRAGDGRCQSRRQGRPSDSGLLKSISAS